MKKTLPIFILSFLLYLTAHSQPILRDAQDSLYYKDALNRIKDQSRFIRIDSNNAEAYFRRGKIEYEIEDYTAALKDYQKALQLTPESNTELVSGLQSNVGMCYCFLKEYEKALVYQKKSIELTPEDPMGYLNIAYTQQQAGDLNAAIENLGKAIELKPEYLKAYANRGSCKHQQGKYTDAIADYDAALAIDPNYADAYYARGITRFELGDYDGAIADYKKVFRLMPGAETAFELYEKRGKAYEKKGEKEKAAADFVKAKQLKPPGAK